MNFKYRIKKRGVAIISSLIFGSIAVIIISGLVSWFGGLLNSSRVLMERETAFHIAEAGIEYYRWHLAHAPQDYKDGINSAGPYIHPYLDKNGELIGQFTLNIIPPETGSSVVTIESTGHVLSNLNVYRKIRVKMAIPSIAKFAVVTNSANRFGEGTEVFGPIHANGGVRFDGIAHNIITSTVASYDDPDHTGGVEFGVHTHVKEPPANGVQENPNSHESPPNAVMSRPEVFMAGRQFPAPAFDFSGISGDLASLKTTAQTGGRYITHSGVLGYNFVLKENDTYDLYKVTSFITVNGACNKNERNDPGWGLWSIKNQQFVGNYAFPTNGIIFVEDNIWVEGKINGARLTIVAAKYPDNPNDRKNIIINKDILYTKKDGTDAIALIAQNNISVGMASEDNLEINAALIAQNGRVGRFYYKTSQCNEYQFRDTITLFGMIASNQRYGFAYADNNGHNNGYEIRNIIYDSNLLFNPPPGMPLTSDQYTILSWEEIK